MFKTIIKIHPGDLTGQVYHMVIPEGLEPPTYRLGICRSILMSYGTINLLCPNL
jgi:hypothetical protein